MTASDSLRASATIRNEGVLPVTEVLQLYLHDKVASRVRPVRELKGFARVPLAPGEEKEVSFEIQEELLRFVGARGVRESEKGLFEVAIGLDSRAPFTAEFTLC